MNTLKKIVAAGAAASLSFGLVACNSNGGDSADGGDKPSADANTLTVWAWDPAFNILALQEAEKIYQKDHPDFKLNIVEMKWDDVQTKLTTLASSKNLDELPDIFLTQNNAFQKNLINYPELFADYEGSKAKFDEFPEGVVNFSVTDGKHYGLPFDSGTAIGAYRVDMLEQAGLSIDDMTDISWDKFIENGKKVKEATGKPLLTSVAGESDLTMMMLQSAGISMFNDSGEADIKGNDGIKEAVETYAKLVSEGVLQEVNSWDEYVGSFTQGNAAAVINGVWIIGSIKEAEDQSGKWAVTNLPKLDNASGATNFSANGGSSWAVSATANKELAQDFLASTFGGSKDLYDTILPKAGAVANWLPAGESSAYGEKQEFFGGQEVFKDVVDFSKKVPSINTGVYWYEARDAISAALTKVVQGTSADEALDEAHKNVEFAMN